MSATPRTIYNTRTVKQMSKEDRDAIIAAGVPIEFYTKGILDLGARNSTAIARMANVFTTIYKEHLPIPPSQFIEYVCGRTSGPSKQDFSATVDGKKGSGKSRTSIGAIGCRYGIEMAQLIGGVPTDYFTLDNCALLEDTRAISKIMSNARRHQLIVIDDASVALGSRDFAQEKNKNFNRLLTTCRTRRWAIILNVPMASHLDLQIRELVDAKISIFKSFHAGGFNIVKALSSDVQFRMNKKHIYEKRFDFTGKKIDFWGAFSSDIFEGVCGGCYNGYDEKYDKQRDEATSRVLSEVAEQEDEMADPRGKREKSWDGIREEFSDDIRRMMKDPEFLHPNNGRLIIRRVMEETGLNSSQVYRLVAEIKGGRKVKEKKK